MDNKITKQRLNNHLEYDWFKYIIFILVAVFLWSFIYSLLDKIKDREKLDIFITTAFSSEKAQAFETDFIKFLQSQNDQSLKQVNFSYNDYNDQDTFFPTLATSYKIFDLVIAQEEAFRYLAATNRLVGLDYDYDFSLGNIHIQGSVFDGFTITEGNSQTTISPYLNIDDFDSYYILDDNQKQKALDEFIDLQISDNLLNKKFGIELNSLAPNLFFNYEERDQNNNPTGNYTKYYIGVVSLNLSNKSGGGNKGVFNAPKQDIKFKQAWDAIIFLKNSGTKYSI
mgnify:CR=1 FL=1